MQGAQDQLAPPEFPLELQRCDPQRSELERIPDAGHALLFDRPEPVIERDCQFLERFQQPAQK